MHIYKHAYIIKACIHTYCIHTYTPMYSTYIPTFLYTYICT